MPDMVGTPGSHDAIARCHIFRVRLWRFIQDPPNCRYAQMQSCPAKRLGDLDLTHGRVQNLQTLYDVADKIREFIHRFAQLQQSVRAVVINAFHLSCNRVRGDEEGVGCLFEGPAPRGTKLEDRHALDRPILLSALRHDLRHTGILEAEFLA